MIVISGMHRSGTSLLARAVNLLGVDLGPERYLLPPTADNPVGYWEDNRIVQLDDQLLGFLDGWWHQPPTLDENWQYDWHLEPFRVWAAQLVADRLDAGVPTGFKDPRLSLLLPFWRTVVDVDCTVVGVRHPVEVCASLAARDGFSTEWSAYLWLRYTASAVVSDPEALIVRYDDWFNDSAATAAAIAAHLGFESVAASTLDEIAVTCDPALRRSTSVDVSKPDLQDRLLARATALFQCLPTGPAANGLDTATAELANLRPPNAPGAH